MALAIAATAATTTALAAYLDARLHLRKDLGNILDNRRTASIGARAAATNKRSLWYFFENQAQKLRDQPCLWYRDHPSTPPRTYTWTETYECSLRWSQFLLEEGVKPGELVGTLLMNGPEYMFHLLGCWAMGTAPAMLNYNLSGDALVHCLKVAGCRVVVVDEDAECRARVEAVREQLEVGLGMTIVMVDTQRIFAQEQPVVRPADEVRDSVVTADFPIFLFYTSGTTGHPKACAFPTFKAYGLGAPRLRTTGLKPGDVWYDCMPLYHGTGCTVAISCMTTGVTLAIGRKFSVRNFWPDIHDSRANAFVYVGETARYLLAAPPSPLDRGHKLKAMYGNGMRPDVWEKFQARFDIPTVNEFFNSTEGMLSLLNVCRGPFHAAHVGHHGALERRKFHNILVPVAIDHENSGAIWRDPKTGFAKRNTYDEGGEIIIACRSESDFVGYWNNPAATQGRFERDVFRKGDLYYRTGDALRRDNDGRWFFLDRLGDTFRWKSENVSTAEVAEVLGRFPGVVEANVYGVEVPHHDGRAGCAAIYMEGTQQDWERGLLAHARKLLPKYAVPVFVRVIAKPTPSHNQKQNKMPLKKEGVDLEKIRAGEAGREDVMFWCRPGGERYEVFAEEGLRELRGGKARL